MKLNEIKGLEDILTLLPNSKSRLKNFLGNSEIQGVYDLKDIVKQWDFLNYYNIPKNEKTNITCDFDGQRLKNIFVIKNKKNDRILTVGPDDFLWLTEIGLILDIINKRKDKEWKSEKLCPKEELKKVKDIAKKKLKKKESELIMKFNEKFEAMWREFIKIDKRIDKKTIQQIKQEYKQKYEKEYNSIMRDIKRIDVVQKIKLLDLHLLKNKSILNTLFELKKNKKISPALNSILIRISKKNIDDFFEELSDSERELLFEKANQFKIYDKNVNFSSFIKDIKYLKEPIKTRGLELLIDENITMLDFKELGEVLATIPYILQKRVLENAIYSLKLNLEDVFKRTHKFEDCLYDIYKLLIKEKAENRIDNKKVNNQTNKKKEIKKKDKEKLIKKIDETIHYSKKEFYLFLKTSGFNASDKKEIYHNSLSYTNIKDFHRFSEITRYVYEIKLNEELIDSFKKQYPKTKILYCQDNFIGDYLNSFFNKETILKKITSLGWNGKRKSINKEKYSISQNLLNKINKIIKNSENNEYKKYFKTERAKEVMDFYKKLDKTCLIPEDEKENVEDSITSLLDSFYFIKNNPEYDLKKNIYLEIKEKINWKNRKYLREESNYLESLGFRLVRLRGLQKKWARNGVSIPIEDIFSISKYLQIKNRIENPKIKLKAFEKLELYVELSERNSY